jgi:holliday junction DNA helicase RuvA
MIAQLRGTISYYDTRFIILDVGGVGYKVYITPDIVNKLSPEERTNVTLWTYLAVRDDALDLYGFLTHEELKFFELLITISGIGPKTALGILNVASVHSLQTAVSTEDTSHLIKVSGLSKKIAEKIVRELQDKIDHIEVKDEPYMRTESDAIEALKALGYNHSEARDALKKIDKSLTDTGAKVKAALKLLGK